MGAHFGLTPKKYQSGETDVTGGISKVGNAMVRSALYEAANVMSTRAVILDPEALGARGRWASRHEASQGALAASSPPSCIDVVDGTSFVSARRSPPT